MRTSTTKTLARILAAATLVGSLALAGGSSPAGAEALQVTNKTVGNCTLRTYTDQVGQESGRAIASVSCTGKHTSISASLELRVHRPDGSVAGRKVVASAANASSLPVTGASVGWTGCVGLQSILVVTVSGLPTTSVSTGAPISSCAIKPDAAHAEILGRSLAAARGWTGAQATCLDNLFTRESGWRYNAENTSSGAYGIPQALPGSKMGSVASDWKVNAKTQITWGLDYIAGRYTDPCGAWAHSQSVGWY